MAKNDANEVDMADVTEDNIKINDSELNELENEFGSFNITTGSDDPCENFVSRAEDLVKFDDFREQQNKVLAFLSSEYGEYYEAGSDKRSHELSCIKEEDHVELNESVKQNEITTSKENLDVNEDSQSSINISNNSDRNYSRLPSIYFKRTEKNDHDSTLTSESIKFDQTLSNVGGCNNKLDNIFDKSATNQNDCFGINFSMNGTNQQAFFSQQQLGISIGEFRSGEMLVEELANYQEVLQTTATGSVEKSWFNNVNDQQTSKLDL
jgi:hypothetical protein